MAQVTQTTQTSQTTQTTQTTQTGDSIVPQVDITMQSFPCPTCGQDFHTNDARLDHLFLPKNKECMRAWWDAEEKIHMVRLRNIPKLSKARARRQVTIRGMGLNYGGPLPIAPENENTEKATEKRGCFTD